MESRKLHAKQPTESSHAGSRSTRSISDREPSADSLLSEIRQLLEAGEIRTAKRLASKAVRRHPEHAEIGDLHRTLNEGRSSARPGTGRDLRPEYAWLRDPPKQYRGRWVALIGEAIVGSAESLEELLASLPPQLDQTPLAIQIPS